MTITQGFEAFGCVPDGHGPNAGMYFRPMKGPVEWPELEVTDGITHIQVEFSMHGDDPSSAFICVRGSHPEAVLAAYHRMSALFLTTIRPAAWPSRYPKEG